MRKGLVGAVVGLVLVGAAAAAWVVYSGSSGTADGSFVTANSVAAIAFSTGQPGTAVSPCTAGSGATCTGGTPGVINVALTNNDPSNAHAAVSPVIAFSTSPTSGCASHLFVTGTTGLSQTVAAGGTGSGSVTFVADPSTPAGCSGATITATISGGAS